MKKLKKIKAFTMSTLAQYQWDSGRQGIAELVLRLLIKITFRVA